MTVQNQIDRLANLKNADFREVVRIITSTAAQVEGMISWLNPERLVCRIRFTAE